MYDCRIRRIRAILVRLAERNAPFNLSMHFSSELWLDKLNILQIGKNSLWEKKYTELLAKMWNPVVQLPLAVFSDQCNSCRSV